MTMEPKALLIRDAREDDLPAILSIHNDEILHGTAIWWRDPVDLANRRALLATQRAKSYPYLVAEADGRVAGYASFGEFRPQDGYDRTVETSLYVHPNHRGRGVAAALMPALIEAARHLGKHAMVGGIDATNEASLRLHRRFGFVETGRLPQVGFKFGRYLDLVFMQLLLDATSSVPST